MRVVFDTNVYISAAIKSELAENLIELAAKTDLIILLTSEEILECALAGEADLIVSSDQDLIKLKNFQGIGIVHPKTLSWTFPEYFKKKN